MGIDLSNYTRVVEDEFEGDALSPIWSTGPRRGLHANTSPNALFLDGTEVDADGDPIGLDPLTVDDGVLAVGSGIIPDDKLADVKQLLRDVGQGNYANTVKYYTGMIASDQSWAQTYGYFEIVAKIPVGEGHWPAFWMVSESQQWPPEIDIVEAYGRQLSDDPVRRDGVFPTAVHFDEYDENGARVFPTRIQNPYELNANGDPTWSTWRTAGGKTYGHFTHRTDTIAMGVDPYEEFGTYAMEWTPTYISFLFGPDRDSLVEVYRVPTPGDVHVPLYVQANDQINGNWGWNVIPGTEDQVFAEGNDFEIDSISIYARDPDAAVAGSGPASVLVGNDAGTMIVGSAGDDRIVTGADLDVIDLRSGSDTVFIGKGNANTIISGLGRNDTVVIDGWYLDGETGAASLLVQVGADVWLSKGAYPDEPQSVIFRDTTVAIVAGTLVVRGSTTPDIWSAAGIDGTRLGNSAGTNYVEAAPEGSKLSDAGPNGGGIVTLRGSDHGDLFYVYRNGTIILENAGGGVDTVYAHRSLTLAEHVEGLVGNVATDGLVLTGNGLNNRIVSGGGAQVLAGAGGHDLIDIAAGTASEIRYGRGDGHDVVTGFGGNDRLVLTDIAFSSWAALSARLEQAGADVMVDLGTGQSVTLRNVSLPSLTAANFGWVDGPTSVTGTGFDPYWKPGGPVSDAALHRHTALLAPYTLVYADGGGTLSGTGRDDALFADGSGMTLQGRVGRDLLYGGAGDDKLLGQAGNDRMEGGDGADRLTGGAGADTFVFAPGDSGVDTVTDFGAGDRLDVSAFGAQMSGSGIDLAQRSGWLDLYHDGALFASVRGATLASGGDALLWDGQYG